MTGTITSLESWNATRWQPPAQSFGTVMLDEQMLADFRARPVAVLSPHFDDACFSLGCLLARLGHGELINIFTQGNHLVDKKQKTTDQEHVYQIRDAEDSAFAARCGLNRHDLGCEEPSLRGRRPSELHRIADDIAQITQPVLGKLARLAGAARGVLFAPLGIGRHVNHRATARMVLNHLPQIHAQYDVFLYEELPYASKPLSRMAALRRASHAAVLGARHALRSEWDEKAALLMHYPSQLAGRPARPQYWPSALSPLTPHEAFWPVTPQIGAPRDGAAS